MVSGALLCWTIGVLLIDQVYGAPAVNEGLPLTLVSDFTSRLGAHPSRLQEARLPLPTPQDLENIKKVAQILITLGQQVIPAIIGEPMPSSTSSTVESAAHASVDVQTPNDEVKVDELIVA